MLVREQLSSGESLLDLRIATTGTRPILDHALVLVHGLPRAYGMGRQAAGTLPELAEHVANETGWLVATGTMSGVGSSTGTFSVAQWRDDLVAIMNRIVGDDRPRSSPGRVGCRGLRRAGQDERAWSGSSPGAHTALRMGRRNEECDSDGATDTV